MSNNTSNNIIDNITNNTLNNTSNNIIYNITNNTLNNISNDTSSLIIKKQKYYTTNEIKTVQVLNIDGKIVYNTGPNKISFNGITPLIPVLDDIIKHDKPLRTLIIWFINKMSYSNNNENNKKIGGLWNLHF